MQWDDLRVLLATARQGSASRAAASLGVAISTVTRRLAQLEEACGAPLFARTPDGVQLTDAGAALLPHAEAAERAVVSGQAAVEAVGTMPRGNVSVTLPLEVLGLVVLPQLPGFEARFPQVTVTWRTAPDVLDVPRREVDIAVRSWLPSDDSDSLLMRRVRTVTLAAYGSASYLATVEAPSDPASHRWLGSRFANDPLDAWVRDAGGTFTHQFETPLAIRMAAACGLGAAMIAPLFADLTPGLQPIDLAAAPPKPLDIYLVTHRAVRHVPAVAAMWEFLVDAVGGTTDEEDAERLDEFQRRYFR